MGYIIVILCGNRNYYWSQGRLTDNSREAINFPTEQEATEYASKLYQSGKIGNYYILG